MVPPASKHRRTLWVRAQMPAWDTPKDMNFEAASQPWWLFQKGQVLTVLARPSRQYDHIWVPVSFKQGECTGWILGEHAYACPRHRIQKSPPAPAMQKPRPARLSDLRPGVVLEYQKEMAIVVSWSSNKLPTPKELACVRIEQPDGIKDVWLTQLQTP